MDHHLELARRLIDENQVVALEGLNVAGSGRARLAQSVRDAGWSTPTRLTEEKAVDHGRRVVMAGRWEPPTQVCTVRGVKDGKKSLSVRERVGPVAPESIGTTTPP